MKNKAKLKEEIDRLKVHVMPVNHWEGTTYKPYTLRLVELDKVLEIIKNLESDHSDEEAAFTEEDVENLANEYITNLYGKGAHGSLADKRKASFIEGYKAASKTFTDYLKSKQEL